MEHAYLTQSLIEEALQAKAITELEAKELLAQIALFQPALLKAS